jgi:hypothetical protein
MRTMIAESQSDGSRDKIMEDRAGDLPHRITTQAALEYVTLGWAIVPIPAGKKEPMRKGWQKLRLKAPDVPEYFPDVSNIGVLNGTASGGLVDVDLDTMEAVRLADAFLPATGAVFGRSGKPRSHRLYMVTTGSTKTRKFSDENVTYAEVRGDNSQTIFPPSIHPSGERVRWDQRGDPAPVLREDLDRAVGKVAAAALLTRKWPTRETGGRHDTALALSGALLRNGWSPEDASAFIRAVVEAAGDEEPDDRERTIDTTIERLSNGDSIEGIPTLALLLGARVVDLLCQWLRLGVLEWPSEDNAKALTENPPPPPRFIIPDILAAERVTFCIGKPKKGKSTLATQIALHVIGERPLWGQATSVGESVRDRDHPMKVPAIEEPLDVLYLALEEDRAIMAERILAQLGHPVGTERLHIFYAAPLLGDALFAFLEAKLKEYPNAGLIVIDPLILVLPPQSRDNPYQREYENVTKLKKFAALHHVAFWINHHARKAAATEVTDASLSTSGQPGAADRTILLERKQQESHARLIGEGRVGGPLQLALEFDADQRLWENLGDAEAVASAGAEQAIVQLAVEVGLDVSFTPKQVASDLGFPTRTVGATLKRMVEKGILTRPAYGKYQLDLEWWDLHSQQYHRVQEKVPQRRPDPAVAPTVHVNHQRSPRMQVGLQPRQCHPTRRQWVGFRPEMTMRPVAEPQRMPA